MSNTKIVGWTYVVTRPEFNTRRSSNVGTSNGASKLTEAQVLEIRSRDKENQTVLAAEFGVQQSAINKILKRRSWKHI